MVAFICDQHIMFPISRDPPEGGTRHCTFKWVPSWVFPISRDPPEGGTIRIDKPDTVFGALYPFPLRGDP